MLSFFRAKFEVQIGLIWMVGILLHLSGKRASDLGQAGDRESLVDAYWGDVQERRWDAATLASQLDLARV